MWRENGWSVLTMKHTNHDLKKSTNLQHDYILQESYRKMKLLNHLPFKVGLGLGLSFASFPTKNQTKYGMSGNVSPLSDVGISRIASPN